MLSTTQVHAHQLDDGAAYDVYVPPLYDRGREHRLLVSVLPVHPVIPIYRALELFSDFADGNDFLLLGPRFEMASGFQSLGIGGPVRYDMRLLQMVEDVARAYAVKSDKFDLFGYSAGGQFAHRFMYLHRERLRAVVIGAPGTITLPGTTEDWPAGLRDIIIETGDHWPRILLFVGDQDVSMDFLQQSAEANRFGLTRVERARTLHSAWLAANISHEYLEVPGMVHADVEAMNRLMPRVWQFFQ